MIDSDRMLYVLLMFLSASISMVLAILAFRSQRNVPRTKPFAMMALGGSAWMVSVALDMLTNNLVFKSILWWLIPLFILITLIGLFIFSLEFSLHLDRVPKAVLYPVIVTGLVIAIFSATNNIHHLMWTVTITDGYYTQIMGNFFWVQLVFTYLLTFGSFALLILAYLRSKGIMRRQTVFLLVGIIIPILVSIAVDVFGLDPLPHIDEPALSSMITVLLFGWITFRFNNIFQLLPVASDVIIKHMHDMVLVTNLEGIIIFSNPAAQLFFGRTAIFLNGYNVARVLEG